jgi:hypothetical protein
MRRQAAPPKSMLFVLIEGAPMLAAAYARPTSNILR